VRSERNPLFSVVQWQDEVGNWHDIEGWRGAVSNGQTIWWVEQKDWSAGPYRWVVYEASAGAAHALATSWEFTLPAAQGEIRQISLQVR
jgi:hypothetical protein